MATDSDFIAHILDQCGLGDRLTARKMFGEYGFHLDGTFVALACDNEFFVKETPALGRLSVELPRRPPYPGARPYPVADELLDDPGVLKALLLDTAAELPPPKNRRRRR